MMKFAILFALVAAVSADPLSRFNPVSSTGRIVGGEAISIDLVPYQVSLQLFGFHVCGGTIISEEWILTSAQCVNHPLRWFSVRSGTTVFNSGGVRSYIDNIIVHEDFDKKNIPVDDIALIHLSSPLYISSVQAPIGLYPAGQEIPAGAAALISGWGSLENGGTSVTGLRAATLPIVSKDDCSHAYRASGGIPENQICAAEAGGGKDFCANDFGTPLVVDGLLAGIASWGIGCGTARWPGVYTEVSAYRDWITANSGV